MSEVGYTGGVYATRKEGGFFLKRGNNYAIRKEVFFFETGK